MRPVAFLDKGQLRRNKGTKRNCTLCARIHEELTDREHTALDLLVLEFRTGGLGERHEGR